MVALTLVYFFREGYKTIEGRDRPHLSSELSITAEPSYPHHRRVRVEHLLFKTQLLFLVFFTTLVLRLAV